MLNHDERCEAAELDVAAILENFENETRARLASRGITPGAKVLCPKCSRVKPVDEFYIDKSKASGRRSNCKACNRDAAATLRALRAAGRASPRRRRSGAEIKAEAARVAEAKLNTWRELANARSREEEQRRPAPEIAAARVAWWEREMEALRARRPLQFFKLRQIEN